MRPEVLDSQLLGVRGTGQFGESTDVLEWELTPSLGKL